LDLSACQILVEIPQILSEFLDRFTLCQIVREVLEVAEPHAVVLPMNIPGGVHGASILSRKPWKEGEPVAGAALPGCILAN
jgi:hypothetical protein